MTKKSLRPNNKTASHARRQNENVAPRKSLGQHFLTSIDIARKITESAKLQKGATVYEIGPGTGMLTETLLEKGCRVIAVEPDKRSLEVLRTRFSSAIAEEKLTLVEGDAREQTPTKLGLSSYGVVANIPYFITGALIRMLFSQPQLPHTMVLLVQKEVAERITKSKKESILSLSVKAFGKPKYVRTVRAGSFNPPPNVDSAILLVEHISRDSFKTEKDEQLFFELLHAGFSEKRKRLKKNLEKVLHKENLDTLWKETALEEGVRAEDLPLSKWIALVSGAQKKISGE